MLTCMVNKGNITVCVQSGEVYRGPGGGAQTGV